MSAASEFYCLVPYNEYPCHRCPFNLNFFSFLISLLNPFALISKVGYLLVFLQPVISDMSWIEACCDKARYFCFRMHFFPLLDGAYNLFLAIPWTYAGHLLLILLPCL
jgi:hypothetical protein